MVATAAGSPRAPPDERVRTGNGFDLVALDAIAGDLVGSRAAAGTDAANAVVLLHGISGREAALRRRASGSLLGRGGAVGRRRRVGAGLGSGRAGRHARGWTPGRTGPAGGKRPGRRCPGWGSRSRRAARRRAACGSGPETAGTVRRCARRSSVEADDVRWRSGGPRRRG